MVSVCKWLRETKRSQHGVCDCVYEVLGLASAILRERSNDSFYPSQNRLEILQKTNGVVVCNSGLMKASGIFIVGGASSFR